MKARTDDNGVPLFSTNLLTTAALQVAQTGHSLTSTEHNSRRHIFGSFPLCSGNIFLTLEPLAHMLPILLQLCLCKVLA